MATFARFSSGSGPIAQGTDNTDRVRDNAYVAPVYAAVLALIPSKSFTLFAPADLSGALTVNVGVGSANTAPYVGDAIQMIFKSTPGATVTVGTGALPVSATIIIPAGKTANIALIFNGAAWVETGRAVTA